MTTDFFPPSIDPSARGDLTGTIKFVLTKFLQGIDDMLPAVVIEYDRTTNLARVEPLIAVVTTAGTVLKRGQIASIQVLQLGGGGFVLSFPIKTGDLGWIKANDADISLFKQSFETATPNTARLHNFSDAMFIPDTMLRSVVINSEDEANVVLQTLDGTVRVAIWDNKVKITAPTVQVVAPVVTVTASTSITLDSPLTTITGALSSGPTGGAATFGGSITATGEITSGTIPLTTHKHTGVQTGGSNTGNPVP